MPDLATWALIGETVGGLAVVSGVAYAIFELRRTRRQRVASTATEFRAMFATDEYVKAARIIHGLPEGADPRNIAADAELAQAAALVATVQFTLGSSVYLGNFPKRATWLQDPWHTWDMWVRLWPWIKASRKTLGPSSFWAFEWLIGEGQRMGALPGEPAADPTPFMPGDGVAEWEARHG